MEKLRLKRKNIQLAVFLTLAIIVVLIAIFAPVIVPKNPFKMIAPSLRRPSRQYIFGTDHLGRDLFSRIIYGSRYSIFMTLVLVFIVFFIGTVLGVVAGYFGGIIDTVIMRFGDMMIAFPGLIFAIAIAGLLNPSAKNSVIAIAAVTWTKYARLARSMVLKIKQELYISCKINRKQGLFGNIQIYNSKYDYNDDSNGSFGYRNINAGNSGTFISRIWSTASNTRMGSNAQ